MQDGIVLKEIAKEETQSFSSREYDFEFPSVFCDLLAFKGLQGAYLCYLCCVILNGNLRDYTKLTYGVN
jgi:hypothetical protein